MKSYKEVENELNQISDDWYFSVTLENDVVEVVGVNIKEDLISGPVGWPLEKFNILAEEYSENVKIVLKETGHI